MGNISEGFAPAAGPSGNQWPADLQTEGLAGIKKLVSRIEINKKMKNINLFVVYLIIGFC